MTEKRIERIKVASIMTRNVVTIDPNATIAELHDLLVEHDYNALPVVKNGKLVGIITKLDLMKVFSSGTGFTVSGYFHGLSEKASDIMHAPIVDVRPEDDLMTVVDYMVEYKLRSIPVTEGNVLVGIISRGDVIKHLIVKVEE
jgi:CBS domain-containing protein